MKTLKGVLLTFQRTNSKAALQPVRTMSNLSILLKDKSQADRRHVHPWWTNQWLGLHWSSEADNEPSICLLKKPKKKT